MNLTVGDQVCNGITTYTILKVNYDERYYHVITNYLTTAKLKFDTVDDDRYIYCGHINFDKSLDFITNDCSCWYNKNNDCKKPMTVLDLLNKTNISSNELIEIRCPRYGFQIIVGCSNKNITLYKKFINAYGGFVVDEITTRKTDSHIIYSIKIDYYD
jgi:hypothetical protein